jgi:hypothetical protein
VDVDPPSEGSGPVDAATVVASALAVLVVVSLATVVPVVAAAEVTSALVCTGGSAPEPPHATTPAMSHRARTRFARGTTPLSRAILPGALALVALALAACRDPDVADDAATDPSTSTAVDATTTQTTTADSESDGPCGAGLCAAPPPEGWFGPLVRFEHDGSATPPACDDAWPDPAFSLLGGFVDPGPAVCSECVCGIDLDALCTLTGYRTEGSDVCDFRDPFQLEAPGTCEDASVDDGSLWLYAFTELPPVCTADFAAEIPEVDWALEVTGCRGAELGETCDDAGRQCLPPVPAGFDDDLCIFANGDLPCPEGDYSEKSVWFSSVDDTRSCGQCICGDPPDATCSGAFEMFAAADCSGEPTQTHPADVGCAGAVQGVSTLRFAYDGPTTCALTQAPAPQGTVAPAGAITYCCLP